MPREAGVTSFATNRCRPTAIRAADAVTTPYGASRLAGITSACYKSKMFVGAAIHFHRRCYENEEVTWHRLHVAGYDGRVDRECRYRERQQRRGGYRCKIEQTVARADATTLSYSRYADIEAQWHGR